MHQKIRCKNCVGSGRVRGRGMMQIECETCYGTGRVIQISDEVEFLNIKHSEAYQNARERLRTEAPSLTEEEAETMLDEAFKNESPPKRGRKSKNEKE